ncbi:MAG: hypothetical protein J5935_00760, partial [Lachnospiraceae bacterium]|nr:hypothetical protein [Lachnospiraceae bacterium]
MNSERFMLETERIREIAASPEVGEAYDRYFRNAASFLLMLEEERRFVTSPEEEERPLSVWEEKNHALYSDVLPENYKKSYADPAFAVAAFGEDYGRFFSTLLFELRSAIPFAYDPEEASEERFMQRLELFLEVHSAFSMAHRENTVPPIHALHRILYRYLYDCMMDETLYEVGRSLAGVPEIAGHILSEGDP